MPGLTATIDLLRRHERLVRQFLIFAIVGGVSAVGHFGTLAVLVETGLASPVPASAIGFVIAASMSYVMNRQFTFNATRRHVDAAWRFAIVAVIGFLLNGLLMQFFTVYLGIYYLLAQAITTLLVMVSNFLGYRIWAFAHADTPRAGDP